MGENVLTEPQLRFARSPGQNPLGRRAENKARGPQRGEDRQRSADGGAGDEGVQQPPRGERRRHLRQRLGE